VADHHESGTRRLIQVVPDDIKKTEEFLTFSLGITFPEENPISRTWTQIS